MNRWRATAAAATAISTITVLGAGTPSADAAGQTIILAASHRNGGGYGPYAFGIVASSAKSLYPGAVRRIDLTFLNPYPGPLRISAVAGALAATSKRACRPTATNLRVSAYHGALPLTVASRSRKAAGYIELRMPNSVADACQSVTFYLEFTGTASEVGR
jgi:hypothetical protein